MPAKRKDGGARPASSKRMRVIRNKAESPSDTQFAEAENEGNIEDACLIDTEKSKKLPVTVLSGFLASAYIWTLFIPH